MYNPNCSEPIIYNIDLDSDKIIGKPIFQDRILSTYIEKLRI